MTSFHRRKEVISLHKTSFANEEIPDPKICRNGEILRINAYSTKEDKATCFTLVLLVLNENKRSKPKRRGRAFETRFV